MKALVMLVLLGCALALLGAFPAAQESCAVCHGEQGRVEAAGAHAAAGVDCVACHGGHAGALDVAGAHAGGVHVARDPRAALALCGGCHADPVRMRGSALRTDQLLLYAESGHGRRLAQAEDPDVATCVSCHGAHGVLPHTDPRSPVHPRRQAETCGGCHADAQRMQRHGRRSDALAELAASVHGAALAERGLTSAPTCSTCHGSHGATPPGVDEVGRTCGRCHAPVREQFERGPHAAPARAGKIEECVACHGSHAVAEASEALLVGAEPGHCGACHASGSSAAAVGASLHAELGAFDAELRSAEEALARAAARGIFVEHESDRLGQARAVRAQAGPLVHALSPAALSDRLELGRGLVAETLAGLARQEHELSDRKTLVLAFFGVVLLLAGVLVVHAREVAARATGAGGSRAPRAEGERG